MKTIAALLCSALALSLPAASLAQAQAQALEPAAIESWDGLGHLHQPC
jgi:hypothetical protein